MSSGWLDSGAAREVEDLRYSPGWPRDPAANRSPGVDRGSAHDQLGNIVEFPYLRGDLAVGAPVRRPRSGSAMTRRNGGIGNYALIILAVGGPWRSGRSASARSGGAKSTSFAHPGVEMRHEPSSIGCNAGFRTRRLYHQYICGYGTRLVGARPPAGSAYVLRRAQGDSSRRFFSCRVGVHALGTRLAVLAVDRRPCSRTHAVSLRRASIR